MLADIFTKWSEAYKAISAQKNIIPTLHRDIIPKSKCLAAASVADLKREQVNYEPPVTAAKDKDGFYRMNNRIWIPNEATSLKLMIAVSYHCGEKCY